MDRKYDVITLGEILLRLSTPINGRLAQGDTLMKHLGGAELNIASEIGQLGLKTAMISKIPNNLLAAFIKNQMNASRVSENYLISDTADARRIGGDHGCGGILRPDRRHKSETPCVRLLWKSYTPC